MKPQDRVWRKAARRAVRGVARGRRWTHRALCQRPTPDSSWSRRHHMQQAALYDRRAAVFAVIDDVYTHAGAWIWWTSRNTLLKGRSPQQCWAAGRYDEVEQLAESLTGHVAT